MMWKPKFLKEERSRQALSACLGCVLLVGMSVGIGQTLPRQQSIVIDETTVETVQDVPAENPEGEPPFQVAAKGAVLMDASSGTVLFQQNSHEPLPLASVTKIMTMLLVMEAVEDGKITLDDRVTVSERAASMGGSQMYMEPGESHTVAQLMEGVAMASANDGAVAFKKEYKKREQVAKRLYI